MREKLFLFAALLTSICLQAQDDHIGCHHFPKAYEPVPGFMPPMVDDTRSDSIDILNYQINIDVTSAPNIAANTIVSAAAKVDGLVEIELDLLQLTVDSVFVNGVSSTFVNDGFQVYIDLLEVKQTGDEFVVHVYYHGLPTRDASNFGGLVTEQGYIYNLGIGIAANPHNFGRGWFPCFDNFMERSTYEYNVTHVNGHSAHCVGTEIGISDNGDGTKTTSYAMDQLITTYQSSIAISTYEAVWSEHQGVAGTIPIKLVAKSGDTTKMKNAFGNLTGAIDAIESWYGPDVWERVGYVITTVGAMEHPTNIAYPISSISGNANSNTRLISHELTHNWFGNMITLSTERDMWIKEGPAEYGWHLTAEHIFGKEEFLEVVKDNHEYVLNNAHKDDLIFRALSGMPNEFTYGTHTYRKGASVIHNLRGYLGDDLFRVGMQSILSTYLYSHLDAEQFRDQLTLSTGVDMGDFFDAWVFNPGFSVFVEDSIKSEEIAGKFQNDIYIQQKLRGTDAYHNSVPLQMHAFGANGEEEVFELMVSGQNNVAQVETDFLIKNVVFNRDNLLNQSRTATEVTIDEDGSHSFKRTDITMKLEVFSEDFDARVEHMYATPDKNIIPGDFEISDGHYWRILGDFPEANEITVNFIYDGSDENDFDYNLTTNGEDSLLLFYRPDASFAWAPVEDGELKKIIPNDNKGYIIAKNILAGEYTIGKGAIMVSSIDDETRPELNIYPNPSKDEAFVYIDNAHTGRFQVKVFSLAGNLIYQDQGDQGNGAFAQRSYCTIPTVQFPAGQYFVELVDTDSGMSYVNKLVVVK